MGKWHLGHAQNRSTPVGRGFESHVGCLMYDLDSWSKEFHKDPVSVLAADWGRHFENGTSHHFIDRRHATEAITAEAEARIREHRRAQEDARLALSNDVAAAAAASAPLFLYVAYTAPHSPLQPLAHHTRRCAHLAEKWRRDYCGMLVGAEEGVWNITETARRELGDNVVLVVQVWARRVSVRLYDRAAWF